MMNKDAKLIVFQNKNIRRIWFNDEWVGADCHPPFN
jgi:hypothetical protein